MAKTKNDWIKEINAFGPEALGEVTQEELGAMNVGQLKMLKTELEKETGKAAETAATETPADGLPESGFVSMCGQEFDPKKSGSCYKACSKDFPEAFQACSENFKVKPVAKTGGSKPKTVAGAGKTKWNHVANSQAGKIDECVISGKPMTLKEIAEYAEAKEPRTLAHMQHLVADWGIEILSCEHKEGDVVSTVYFWSEKDKRRKGTALAGKSAYKS